MRQDYRTPAVNNGERPVRWARRGTVVSYPARRTTYVVSLNDGFYRVDALHLNCLEIDTIGRRLRCGAHRNRNVRLSGRNFSQRICELLFALSELPERPRKHERLEWPTELFRFTVLRVRLRHSGIGGYRMFRRARPGVLLVTAHAVVGTNSVCGWNTFLHRLDRRGGGT